MKWTIIFLVHAADETTTDASKELFDILGKLAFNKDVRVVVIDAALNDKTENEIKLKIQYRIVLENGVNIVPSDFPVFALGDAKALGAIFKDIATKHTADKYLLFTWDHGAGFGIFSANPQNEAAVRLESPAFIDFLEKIADTSPKNELIEKRPLQIIQNSIFRDMIIKNIKSDHEGFYLADSETNELIRNNDTVKLLKQIGKLKRLTMLTNDELAIAIKIGFATDGKENGKVDVLVMMNCFMQLIETGYALRDCIDYFVAAETGMWVMGYDYKLIIESIYKNPDHISPETIAMNAAGSMEAFYQGNGFGVEFRDVALSVVQPGQSKRIKDAVDIIAGELIKLIPTKANVIKKAINKCEDLTKKSFERGATGYFFYDLLDFIFTCIELDGEFDVSIGELKKAILNYLAGPANKAVIKGANYRKSHDAETGAINGFSIYHPRDGVPEHQNYFFEGFYLEGDFQSSFAKESKWKEYLEVYRDATKK